MGSEKENVNESEKAAPETFADEATVNQTVQPNSSSVGNAPPATKESQSSIWRYFGPGFLVAAAFIGPGTVNTAIKAGGNYGFHLLWAIIFAAIATIIFQGMAARLGLVTKKGLAESLRDYFTNDQFKLAAIVLVFAAIIFGNTAYQAGNLTGAAKGLFHFLPVVPLQVWLLLSSGLAFALIWIGTLKLLKNILMALVVVMSLAFLVAAINSQPRFPDLMAGCFSFEVMDTAVFFAIIGTTVVPYNLFLHSSTIAEQNADVEVDLSEPANQSDAQSNDSSPSQGGSTYEPTQLDYAFAGTRMDNWIAVWIGAVVTGAIVVTAASDYAVNFDEAANSLTGLIGGFGKTLFFVGLFAAGLTSSITAPLAAGYVYAGCFGHPTKANDFKVRQVAGLVVIIGYLLAAGSNAFGFKPFALIFLAQVANGIILPVIAIFLLVVMNSKKLLGPYRNSWQQNLFGGLVVAFLVVLGLYRLGAQFGIF